MKQVPSLRKDFLRGFWSFGKEDELVARNEMQRCFQHSSWLLGFLIQYITLLMEMLLCTFCFSPSRINSSTVGMPSMHTHSYELWGEAQLGPALIRSQRFCNRAGAEPAAFAKGETTSAPAHRNHHTPLQTGLGSQWIGARASGCLEVLWESCRNRTLLFHSVMKQRGKKTPPLPTEQLTLPSLLIQSALLLLPGINLFQGCACPFIKK